ncbi:MAG: hypothetical protein MK101_05570 [Phycisphaerales bacterium]|nr:hypothetical protein [Phycisphaerales bacterium]
MQRQFLTASLAGALMLGSTATADLQGLDFELLGTNLVDPALTGNQDNYTIDIWVRLDAGNRIDAVAGNASTTKLISSSGTFYQSAVAGPTSASNNEMVWPAFPAAEFDSYITIGCVSSQCGGLDNAIQNIGIDFSDFENNGGDIITNNGTYFVTPDQPIGDGMPFDALCPDGEGVRVARLTVIGLENTVEFNALIQGREADGSGWPEQVPVYGMFTYSAAEWDDCNGNGINDGCDFLNGDLNDDNGDGVYDECEFNDCNENGVNDADDIADGTSQDCNGNSIPDECDIADGTSSDCNTNGIPDVCEVDCDGSGTPDDCDIANGDAEDCNENGVPDSCDIANGGDANGNGELDECEIYPYVNLNSGLVSDTAAEAVFEADNGDSIVALAEFFNEEDTINMMGKSLYMSVDEGDANTTASITMAPGAVLDGGTHVFLHGNVFSGFSGNSLIQADHHIEATGLTFVRPGAGLEMHASSHVSLSDSVVNDGGTLGILAPLSVDGAMTMLGDAHVLATSMTNNDTIRSSGTLLTDLLNSADAEFQCGADTVLSGSLINDGTVSVNVGTLYILGSLTNNGTIVGDVSEGPGFTGGDEPNPGDGFSVGGSYHAGPDAQLHMPHANWMLSVGGDVDIAINDSANFTMDEATLAMTGASGEIQHLEAMSVDVGSSTSGIDPSLDGHFTLGQLVVRSGSTTLVVDSHDNAEGGAESIYVRHLVVQAGATLDAGSRAVWYETAEINGTIIGDIDVVMDPCPGDGDGNGEVNIDDVLLVIANFGDLCPDGCPADLDGSGDVAIDDLLLVIANFGPCE